MRLKEVIAKDGRSYREISTAAGAGTNFVSQMFSDGKAPSIDNFVAVCGVLNVSPVHILTGAAVTPEMERLLELWASAPPNRRKALLDLIAEEPHG